MDKKWQSANRWLHGQDQTLTSLEHGGDTPREVLEIMDEDRKLKPTETIGALFTDTPTNGIIHVLVQLPEHTRKRSRLTSQVEISDFNNGDFDLGESPAKRKQVMPVATEQAQAFKYATLVGDCITSRHNVALPYPNEKVEKVFVRQCYRDIFDLFLDKIAGGRSFFGISGTPGIGKSLFFVYILYRLAHDPLSPFKPKRICYQVKDTFLLFDMEEYSVRLIASAAVPILLDDLSTLSLYVIDGQDSTPLNSTCVTLFIASPQSSTYQHYERHKNAVEWFFPVWTLDELHQCRKVCFPHVGKNSLDDRYRICGGVARSIFHDDGREILRRINAALEDVNAIICVRNIGCPTAISTAHELVHTIVKEYEFDHVDIASNYVGEQLWIKYAAQMLLNLCGV
ncbi:unnamed protein product [Aphanomyces euteiches]